MPAKKKTARARSSVRETSDTPGTLVCRSCKKTFKKGAKAQPGQNDFHFVCDDCGRKGKYQP